MPRASNRGHADVVRLLLDRNVTVDAESEHGHTALQSAACGGHPDVVGLLLDHNAAVDARDAYGCTALHSAACSDRTNQINAASMAGIARH